MWVRKDFGRRSSFETRTQENTNLKRHKVQAVTTTSFCPSSTMPVLGEPLELSSGTLSTGAWLRAVLFTLLVWATVVCTGIGGTVGLASQSLSNKLTANVQHLQLHGGTSLTSRAVRRDQAAAMSVQHVAGDSQALVWDLTDGAQPAGEVGLQIDTQRAYEPSLSATDPNLKQRRSAHTSRAPPFVA